MPVSRKDHQLQFPETPFWRTKSVTKLGVSVENVVATIETPKSHHGISRSARKNDLVSLPAFFEDQRPISKAIIKYADMIDQSKEVI